LGAPLEEASPWTFDVGIYAFIPVSVKGTSTVDGGSVGLDLQGSDIWKLLNFAISGRGEAWRARSAKDGSAFGFVLDGQYVDLNVERQGFGPTGSGEIEADIRQAIVDMMIGYRFAAVPIGAKLDKRVEVDMTTGIRYNYLRQKIEVTPGLPPPLAANLGGDRSWISPVVGLRTNWVFSDTWNLVVRGDVSGFGVSGENLSWSVNSIAGYRFAKSTTFRFGYRVYDIDFSDGEGANEFAYNVIQHGPFLGLSYRF